MGNFLPIPQKQKENKIDSSVTLPEDKSVKRAGADGLFDNGFEYRLARCPRHWNVEFSASASASSSWENIDDSKVDFCWDCITRLYHIESGDMITATNRKCYISDGPIFEEISFCCQEIVQEKLQRELGYKFITICNDVTRGDPIQILVNREYVENVNKEHNLPTLIVIAGKGKSRAGVLSVKQLMMSGLEIGSAIFYLAQAKKRGLAVILLDPNVRGAPNGMDTIDRSLTFLFGSYVSECPPPSLLILAHSAAGGYLARYLSNGKARQLLLQSIRSLLFTDSTHNIQWVQNNPILLQFLQSSKCLYIRNTSENPSDTFANHKDKKPGEKHEGNIWWHRRFGEIRTVWAGTTEHSLMCWVAREVAWNFFDER